MTSKSPGVTVRLISLSLAVISILAAMPAQARTEANRSFTLAGRQWLLIERMTNSALLAALGVEASPSLSSVHWSRNRFDRTLNELRYGNSHFGMSPADRPEILDVLDRVDVRWRRYDSIFRDIAASPQVTKQQIQELTLSHADTTAALAELVDGFEYFANGGRDHTILSTTINGVGRLRARTQLVLRGLLTIAYDREAAEPRARLAQSVRDFDEILNGLVNGDPERRLLRPPTQEIVDELRIVEEMWRQAQPILDAVATGKDVTSEEIATVAGYASEMAVPLTMTLLMYLRL